MSNPKHMEIIRLIGNSGEWYKAEGSGSFTNTFSNISCIPFISKILNVSMNDAANIFMNNMTEAFVYEIGKILSSDLKVKEIQECFNYNKNKVKQKDKIYILFKYFEKAHSSGGYSKNHCKNIISLLSTPYASGVDKSKMKKDVIDTIIDISFIGGSHSVVDLKKTVEGLKKIKYIY